MPHVVMLVTTNLFHDNRVRREAETLAEAGHRVTVYSHIRPGDVPRLGWESRPGLRAVPVPLAAWHARHGLSRALPHTADLFRWGGSQALLQAAIDPRNCEERPCRADVVHAHDLDTLPAAAWLARRDRSRLVYDSHELFLDQMDLGPDAPSPTWRQKLKLGLVRQNYARLERALIGRADAVITVSQSIADELVARYAIRPPALILNTPRHRAPHAEADTLRRRLGLPADGKIILLQGGVLPGRGLLELVGSLLLLPESYRLVFLGFNLGTYQAEIRREVDRLNLGGRVTYLDALPPEQLLDATASADVGIVLLPPINQNNRLAMPNKMFEYMMAGLPFIANDLPEIGRVARQTAAGWVISAITPGEIAGAVRQVLDDPNRHRAMREAGLRAAATEYNWEQQAARLLNLYSGLI